MNWLSAPGNADEMTEEEIWDAAEAADPCDGCGCVIAEDDEDAVDTDDGLFCGDCA